MENSRHIILILMIITGYNRNRKRASRKRCETAWCHTSSTERAHKWSPTNLNILIHRKTVARCCFVSTIKLWFVQFWIVKVSSSSCSTSFLGLTVQDSDYRKTVMERNSIRGYWFGLACFDSCYHLFLWWKDIAGTQKSFFVQVQIIGNQWS